MPKSPPAPGSDARPNAQPRQCPECTGILGQLRYVQAHNCGRIEELYYPSKRLPQARLPFSHVLRHWPCTSARWRCGAAVDAEVGRLRMTPCTCQYSRSLGNQQGSIYERGLKTLALTDSALFLPHVFRSSTSMKKRRGSIYQDPESWPLSSREPGAQSRRTIPEIIRERAKRLGSANYEAESEDTADDLARALESVDPTNPLVLRWKQKKARKAGPPGQAAVDRVRDLLGARAPAPNSPTPRQLVEHAAILDTLQTASVEAAAEDLASTGDETGADALRSARDFAMRELGISELKIVSDFPIALCAVGYTRITRDPMRSVLTPFETSTSDGHIPLYIVSSETEGIYFQLDAVRLSHGSFKIVGYRPLERIRERVLGLGYMVIFPGSMKIVGAAALQRTPCRRNTNSTPHNKSRASSPRRMERF